MTPTAQKLYEVCEATWPPSRAFDDGPYTLRDGAGGGKRVSAATLRDAANQRDEDRQRAEEQMRQMGQTPLFMIREGDGEFDQALDHAGYSVIDPVNLYTIESKALADTPIPRVTTFAVWEPLAIMVDLWADGGVGPARIEVMNRATCPKTGLLGRIDDQPAAVAYVGAHDGVAMLHALEVSKRHRRKGMADWMMRAAAFWALDNGAPYLSVLCVKQNTAANALYRGLGFALSGEYHYRIKAD